MHEILNLCQYYRTYAALFRHALRGWGLICMGSVTLTITSQKTTFLQVAEN